MGVWIEIAFALDAQSGHLLSLPLWECGLKCRYSALVDACNQSLPLWECGLKYVKHAFLKRKESHSLRGSVD